MFRLSFSLLRRISYITDVEGDFSYFQRFVCISRVLQWEEVNSTILSHTTSTSVGGSSPRGRIGTRGGTPGITQWAPLQSPFVPPRQAAAPTASSSSSSSPLEGGVTATSSTQAPDVHTRNGLDYDATYSHLIDVSRYRLTFADATSHFVFGGDAFDHGADLTFGRVLLDFKRRFPSRVHLLLGNRDVNKMILYPRMAKGVAGLPPDAAEESCFSLPPLSKSAVVAAAMTEQLRYKEYLRKRQPQPAGAASDTMVTDPVTFLQWTLTHKLGSPNAFDHRRQELMDLAKLASSDRTSSAGGDRVSDADVAASFFAAAQPGGVYYEYLREGVLSVVLDGVLFVHGGVNGANAGFVPSLTATTYAEQITAGEWCLPELQPAAAKEASTSSSLSSPEERNRKKNENRKSALAWLAALSRFKDAAFQEWIAGAGLAGEALRAYVYPRVVAPHSIAVGTAMQLDGPHHISLPAAAYLIESGIHTICGGHQPVGDTPAVVRQPGGFLIVDADNSYCGRDNAFCTAYNRRGAAVMEMVFDSGDADSAHDATGETDAQPMVSSAVAPAYSLVAHGFRADGAPFAFDLLEDLRVGRHVGDGWWVRLPPCDGGDADRYELRRTLDGFRHEDARWATAQEVDALLQQAAAGGQAMVDGDLAPKYTKEELAEVHVHRIKTKVSRGL